MGELMKIKRLKNEELRKVLKEPEINQKGVLLKEVDIEVRDKLTFFEHLQDRIKTLIY